MIRKINLCFLLPLFFSIILSAQSTQLSVRAFSEGFYRQSTGNMIAVLDPVNSPLVCDSVNIGLIDSVTQQTVYCSFTLITTDGYGTCLVPSTFNGQKYLVSIKFKNTFHILSLQTIEITGLPISVDLTIFQNACCNFDTSNGVAKIFSGDVNSDGTIDVTDFLILSQDIQNNAIGYLITDLTGDHVVDSKDFDILNNNLTSGWNDDYNGHCIPILNKISETETFSFAVYPNPCIDNFMISIDHTYNTIQVLLFDALGKICMNRSFEDESDLRFNCKQIQTGIYRLMIITDKRMIKQGTLIVNKG